MTNFSSHSHLFNFTKGLPAPINDTGPDSEALHRIDSVDDFAALIVDVFDDYFGALERKGNDHPLGYSDNNIMYGGFDDDVLDGGESNDRLYGVAGDNTLYGGNDDVYIVDDLDINYVFTVNDEFITTGVDVVDASISCIDTGTSNVAIDNSHDVVASKYFDVCHVINTDCDNTKSFSRSLSQLKQSGTLIRFTNTEIPVSTEILPFRVRSKKHGTVPPIDIEHNRLAITPLPTALAGKKHSVKLNPTI